MTAALLTAALLIAAVIVVSAALVICLRTLVIARQLGRIGVKLRFGQPLTERESAIVSRLDGP